MSVSVGYLATPDRCTIPPQFFPLYRQLPEVTTACALHKQPTQTTNTTFKHPVVFFTASALLSDRSSAFQIPAGSSGRTDKRRQINMYPACLEHLRVHHPHNHSFTIHSLQRQPHSSFPRLAKQCSASSFYPRSPSLRRTAASRI